MAGGSEGHGHLDTGIGSIPMVPSYLLARWIARWQEGVKAMATWIQVICSIPIVYSFLVARWIARWQEGLKAMAMHLDTGIGSIPIVQPP